MRGVLRIARCRPGFDFAAVIAVAVIAAAVIAAAVCRCCIRAKRRYFSLNKQLERRKEVRVLTTVRSHCYYGASECREYSRSSTELEIRLE